MILLLPFPFLAVVDLYLTWPIAQCNGANTLAAALSLHCTALDCTGRAVTLSPAKRADLVVCVLSRRGFP
jgi:hypothetical protein